MEIEIRCEECGEYLEVEKEYTDRNGLMITVNPCSNCISYWKDHYESAATSEAAKDLT